MMRGPAEADDDAPPLELLEEEEPPKNFFIVVGRSLFVVGEVRGQGGLRGARAGRICVWGYCMVCGGLCVVRRQKERKVCVGKMEGSLSPSLPFSRSRRQVWDADHTDMKLLRHQARRPQGQKSVRDFSPLGDFGFKRSAETAPLPGLPPIPEALHLPNRLLFLAAKGECRACSMQQGAAL
jgi:hypothetical protein